MALRIIRADIAEMETDAVVNTASEFPSVGEGCDIAIYKAAGMEELLELRKKIGSVPEGESFITPGLKLKAQYIIHTVSPLYIDGESGEEEKLRNCYKSSLKLALEHNIKSLAFPLISTGSFGYPKEEGMRIAVEEINLFLLKNEMEIYLVVFDKESTVIGHRLSSDLKSYISSSYVREKKAWEYNEDKQPVFGNGKPVCSASVFGSVLKKERARFSLFKEASGKQKNEAAFCEEADELRMAEEAKTADFDENGDYNPDALKERIAHMTDTFCQYLFYLIEAKGKKNEDVWKKGLVDRKLFSKLKNDMNYHPKKITAMCLCVGLELNMDETRDLLARAGYALSPSDKTDVIFSFFIENEVFDMIEISIALEEYGLPCIIE